MDGQNGGRGRPKVARAGGETRKNDPDGRQERARATYFKRSDKLALLLIVYYYYVL